MPLTAKALAARQRKQRVYLPAAVLFDRKSSYHGSGGEYRIFGDSHVVSMCYERPQRFEVHWAGSRTAHNLREHWAAFAPYIADDKLNLFNFGFIDVRGHICGRLLPQAETAIIDTVGRYLDAVTAVTRRAAVVSVIPVSLASPNGAVHDFWVQRFNAVAQERCASMGVLYIDVQPRWHALRDRGGVYWWDNWHMNVEAGDAIYDVLGEVK